MASYSVASYTAWRPALLGALLLTWTERVFAEDRFAVEAEQRAYDAQGGDWNQEILPFLWDLRSLLASQGVPIDHTPLVMPPSMVSSAP